MKNIITVLFLTALLPPPILVAQSINKGGEQIATVSTAVPFLRISSDLLSSSFGEIDAALANNFFHAHINQSPSLLAGKASRIETNLGYTPLLRSIAKGIHMIDANVAAAFDSLNPDSNTSPK